jgi:hypothetical protein
MGVLLCVRLLKCSDRGLVFMCFASQMVGVRLGLLGWQMAKIMSSRAA